MPTAYATIGDMQLRFAAVELIQLTDDEGAGVIDAGRMDQALASASAMVEGYVAATYDLDPAAPVPILLVDTACDIARFKLFRQTASEDATTRYGQAIRTLEGIRKGTIKLDAGAEAIPAREGVILTQTGDRQMSRRQMRGW